MFETPNSTVKIEYVCAVLERGGWCPRQMKQHVLLFREYNEVVIEVARDTIEGLEVVLEEVAVFSKVLCEVLHDLTIEVAVGVTPVIIDVVVVSVEVLPVDLEIVTAIRINGSNISTSELTMRVEKAPLNHGHEVLVVQVLEVSWK